MVTVPNINNLYNCRYGWYQGKKHLFTHRDPATGDLWGEDIPVGKSPVEYGKWVPGDSVRLIWENGETDPIEENKPSKRSKKKKKKRGNTNDEKNN